MTKMLCLWFPLRPCLICSKLVLFPAGGNRHYFETIKHIYDKIIIMNTAVPVLFWNIYNLFSAENTTRYCRFSRKSSVYCCICWVLILIVFNLSNEKKKASMPPNPFHSQLQHKQPHLGSQLTGPSDGVIWRYCPMNDLNKYYVISW